MALAGRRLHAWWEGYAFDATMERSRLARAHGINTALGQNNYRAEDDIAQSIWGPGRLGPGSSIWTMRFARSLSIPVRAPIVVLGAGAGGVLRDLKTATRWKVSGFSSFAGDARGVDLNSYDQVMRRVNKAAAQAGLCFFELHRDPDPKAFVEFSAELVRTGAPMTFVDFTAARKGRGLKSCFAAPWTGAPKLSGDVASVIESGGFRIVDTSDESHVFTPLIAKGWANWKNAYSEASSITDPVIRAEYLLALSRYAHLWAERLDALRAGQLQVTRFQTRRKG